MKLKVLGSGSKGNCYIMEANNGDNIIIEQGLNFKKILEAMDYDLSKSRFLSGLIIKDDILHF